MKKTGTEKAQEIVQRIAENVAKNKSGLSLKDAPKGMQLTFSWPDEVLAMPNALARSAIFAVIRRGRRRVLDNEIIASRADGLIRMNSKQLDQADGDTWMHLMSLAKKYPLGTRIIINRAQILKAMRRATGTTQYKWLEESISRLHRASIQVETKQYKAALHLIGDYVFDKATGDYWIEMHPQAASLFANEMFGYIDIEKRYALGTDDLAKWLQVYVHSHAPGQRHAIAIKSLHSWCGASGRLRSFRDALKRALKALEDHGIIEDPKIRDDDIATWFRPAAVARKDEFPVVTRDEYTFELGLK